MVHVGPAKPWLARSRRGNDVEGMLGRVSVVATPPIILPVVSIGRIPWLVIFGSKGNSSRCRVRVGWIWSVGLDGSRLSSWLVQDIKDAVIQGGLPGSVGDCSAHRSAPAALIRVAMACP
jgi:hypothetical protein